MPKFVKNYTYVRPKRSLFADTVLKFILIFLGIMLFLYVISDILFAEESFILGLLTGNNEGLFQLTYDGASEYSQSTDESGLTPVPVYTAYIGLIVGALVGAGMFMAAIMVNKLLAPPGGKLRTQLVADDEFAETTYECGENPIGEGHAQINLQYYTFALVFIVFDIVSALVMMFAIVFSLNSSVNLLTNTYSPDFNDLFLQIIGISLFIGLPLTILAFWMRKNAILWQ